MYFFPQSSSSFPISSETGRGLTFFSLPGLTITTPQIKLWLLLAFFLLEIFCFTSTKHRSKATSTTICCTTSITNPNQISIRPSSTANNPEIFPQLSTSNRVAVTQPQVPPDPKLIVTKFSNFTQGAPTGTTPVSISGPQVVTSTPGKCKIYTIKFHTPN